MYEARASRPAYMADARFALARALWPERRARARARELASQARRDYEAAGSTQAVKLARVERWLEERAS